MVKKVFPLLLFTLIFTACTKNNLTLAPTKVAIQTTITPTLFASHTPTIEPTNTPTPSPTYTSSPIYTATPTHTPTNTPTSTPTTAIWVNAGIPVPDTDDVIQADNVTQITELARWGRGVITDIDLSADGQWLAVASGSTVYIHDSHNLNAEPHIIETTGNVSTVAIDPTGKHIALIIQGNELQFWQTTPIRQLYHFDDQVSLIARTQLIFSPNGEVLSSNTRDGIMLFHASTGEVLQTYPSMLGTTFSLDGSKLAVWDYSSIKIYDWQDNTLLQETRPETIHIESDNDDLYGGSIGLLIEDATFVDNDETAILALHHTPNDYVGTFEVQTGSNSDLLFASETSFRLSSATKYVCNEPIIYWDPPELATPRQLEITINRQVAGVLYTESSFGGDYNEYSNLRFYQVDSGQLLYTLEGGVVDFALFPDGQTWVAGFQDGRLEVRRISDGGVVDSVDGYESPILDIVVSPNNEWVGVVRVDDVKIYRRTDGMLIHHYPAHEIAFAPNSQSFALGYEDGRIEVRNILDGDLLNRGTHEDRVTTLAYLPSGDLLSAGFDCNLIHWDVPSMTQLGMLENFTVEGRTTKEQVPVRVRDFLVTPDGETVIGIFYGGDFAVWSMVDGHLLRSPNLDSFKHIYAISPDGRFIAVPDDREAPDFWDTPITDVVGE